MDLIALLIESRITNATAAQAIKMKRGTFNNKLNGNNGSYFTEEELEKIKAFLKHKATNIMNGIK